MWELSPPLTLEAQINLKLFKITPEQLNLTNLRSLGLFSVPNLYLSILLSVFHPTDFEEQVNLEDPTEIQYYSFDIKSQMMPAFSESVRLLPIKT